MFANKLALNFLSAFLNMRGVRDRTDTCCDFQTNFPRLPGRPFVFAGRTGDKVTITSVCRTQRRRKKSKRSLKGARPDCRAALGGGVLLGKRRLDHLQAGTTWTLAPGRIEHDHRDYFKRTAGKRSDKGEPRR
jgi:hypothetical protein